MMKKILFFALGVTFWYPAAGIAYADTQLYQSNASTAIQARYADNTASNPWQLCQSFTGVDGEVDYVKSYLAQRGSGGSATETIGIQADSAGVPTGTFLGSGTLGFASLSGSPVQYSVTLSSPVTVVGANTYWMCWTSSSNNDATDGVYVYGASSGAGTKYREGVSTNTWTSYASNQMNIELWQTAATSSPVATSTTQTIDSPNQDMFYLFVLFWTCFFGFYWVFSKKR